MQKPALGEEIIQETKKVLSDIWNGFENTINGGVYDILSSDEVYELQKKCKQVSNYEKHWACIIA